MEKFLKFLQTNRNAMTICVTAFVLLSIWFDALLLMLGVHVFTLLCVLSQIIIGIGGGSAMDTYIDHNKKYNRYS